MLRRTTSMPTPRPDTSLTASAVEKPGRKIRLWICSSVKAASWAIRPRSRAFARMRDLLRPAPSSLTSMMMLPPSWNALSSRIPVSFLPAAPSDLRHLQPVVEGVAHQVHQRIADLLEHDLVELRTFPVQSELDFLAELARELVHQAREAVEREADRQHADLEHALLQLTRVARELREAAAQRFHVPRIEVVGKAAEHGLGDDQLADQIDERIHFLGGDADGPGFRALRGSRGGGGALGAGPPRRGPGRRGRRGAIAAGGSGGDSARSCAPGRTIRPARS